MAKIETGGLGMIYYYLLTASFVSFLFFAKVTNEKYDLLKRDYEREAKYRIELEKRFIKLLEENL